jgi:hypothetical protein
MLQSGEKDKGILIKSEIFEISTIVVLKKMI